MDDKPNVTDQILDLLLDALTERRRTRAAAEVHNNKAGIDHDEGQSTVVEDKPLSAEQVVEANAADKFVPGLRPLDEIIAVTRGQEPDGDLDEAGEIEDNPLAELPEPVPMMGLGGMLGRLALILVLLIVVVNIPFNRFGTSLARAMPNEAALIIRDGLVLKGNGERIYVLENNQLRWISSLDAFEYFGYRWGQVHLVNDDFLTDFEKGRPIHLLLKCQTSPHIYALEDGRKRWIKDIPTFEARGYVWEDVKFASCEELRDLPNGAPIPSDAGPVPQP